MIMIRLFELLHSKSLEDMTQNTIITEHKAISFAVYIPPQVFLLDLTIELRHRRGKMFP